MVRRQDYERERWKIRNIPWTKCLSKGENLKWVQHKQTESKNSSKIPISVQPQQQTRDNGNVIIRVSVIHTKIDHAQQSL